LKISSLTQDSNTGRYFYFEEVIPNISAQPNDIYLLELAGDMTEGGVTKELFRLLQSRK